MNREREEEYLETIYKLQEQGQAVTGKALAGDLRVSVDAATSALHHLMRKGLVRHAGQQPALTSAGMERAATVVRRHRLAERFLTDLLGLGWDRSHEEACRLEHVLTPEVEERLAAVLGHPATCPHGYPLPTNPQLALPAAQPLSQLPAPARATIVRIAQEDSGLLRYLATLGLMPQTEVLVEERAPFNGPLMVKVGGAHYALGREIADQILVKATEAPRGAESPRPG